VAAKIALVDLDLSCHQFGCLGDQSLEYHLAQLVIKQDRRVAVDARNLSRCTGCHTTAEILDQFFLNTPPKAAPAPVPNHLIYIAFICYLCQPLVILPEVTFAHGGGLNAQGCHNDRKHGGYHCHRGGSSQTPRARPQSLYVTPKQNLYANCTEVRNAGASPLYLGDPGYSTRLDRDGDGVACENGASSQAATSSAQTRIVPVALISAQAENSGLEQPIEGTAQVLDGDTIQIGTVRIRFYGVDAFEGEQRCTSSSGQSYGCGGIATRALADQVEGKLVSCVPKGIDVYKRQLAVCRVEAIDLSAWMARQGHALAYVKYSLDYVSDEQAAKDSQSGAWDGTFEKPWEYRLTRKAAGAEAARVVTRPSPNCNIKGNVRQDGTRIYHKPGDPSYLKVKPENWFCDIDEAARAGFRPAVRE
jgi:endonuclease YncB( thermonuclease family)